jgi:hypothetical protein
MTDFENSIVTSIDSLRTLYAQPIERIAKKQLDHVNEAGRAFIAASPFLVLATGSRQGLDCSPKGDQPGFVEVAEDGRTQQHYVCSQFFSRLMDWPRLTAWIIGGSHGAQLSRKRGFVSVNSMSALGQKQTLAPQKVMSALRPKADMCGALAQVCFGP